MSDDEREAELQATREEWHAKQIKARQNRESRRSVLHADALKTMAADKQRNKRREPETTAEPEDGT